MDQHPSSPSPNHINKPRLVKPGGNWKALRKTLDATSSPSTGSHKRRRGDMSQLSHHDGNTRSNGPVPIRHGIAVALDSRDSKGKARALDAGVATASAANVGEGSSSSSPLPWFAEDLSPEDLALVKGFSSSPGNDVQRRLWINHSSGGTVEEQRRKKQIILGGQWGGDSEAKKEPGQFVAIDCEMVGVGEKGCESVLARVSIVNWHGHVLLDRFVKPMERVTDYRTWVSGVRARDLQGAPSFKEVQAEVATLIKGRVLVGHAIQNDLKALLLSHPRPLVRDTSTFQPLRTIAQTKFPSLKKLAHLVLGVEIQKTGEEHSSIEDARTTMAIFRTQKEAWEKSLKDVDIVHRRKVSRTTVGDSKDQVEGHRIRAGQTIPADRAAALSAAMVGRTTSHGRGKQEAALGWWKDGP